MDKRLNAQELDSIREHAISLMESNPDMKRLLFKLLDEVTQNRQDIIYQFMNDFDNTILADMAHNGD